MGAGVAERGPRRGSVLAGGKLIHTYNQQHNN
jgi:hypothetical protein